MMISDFTLAINSFSLDTLPLFVQLAADTTSAYKEIDLLYETDKTRFQIAASHSPYVNHPLFTTGSIDRQIYAAKYSGIVLAALEDGRGSPLFESALSIMTRRWNELYCHITNCETVDLSEVIQPQYYSSPEKNSQHYNLLTGAATQYIRYFITLYPAIDLPLQAALKFALFIACAAGRKVIVSDPATLSIIQILSSNLDSTGEIELLRNRLNKLSVRKMARYLKNAIYQKIFSSDLNPWRNDRFLEGWAHCNAYLSSEEGISLLSPKLLAQTKERDIELLCRLYIVKMAAETFRSGQLKKSQEDMELDCAEFVMFGLNLLQLVREYKKVKKYYFEHNAAHLCTEVANLRNQLTGCEAEIRKLNAEITAKNTLMAVKDEEINCLVHRQKFMLNSVIKASDQLKPNLEQPCAISSKLATSEPLPVDNVTTLSSQLLGTDASLKALGDIHALVIGGSENWQTKLKNKLPHFTYIHGDTTNFDEALIINADIVFANVRCKFSHDCFYKMIKLVRQHEKRLAFLSKTNIPFTIRHMASAAGASCITRDNNLEYNNIGCTVEL